MLTNLKVIQINGLPEVMTHGSGNDILYSWLTISIYENMDQSRQIKLTLIAPCGMNFSLCLAYRRKKNPCEGCHGDDQNKLYHCVHCSIKHCPHLPKQPKEKVGFCFQCKKKFPCRRLKDLDKRYRDRYAMSMIENLENIKKRGIQKFVRREKKRWLCQHCRSVICVHRDECEQCGAKWKRAKYV